MDKFMKKIESPLSVLFASGLTLFLFWLTAQQIPLVSLLCLVPLTTLWVSLGALPAVIGLGLTVGGAVFLLGGEFALLQTPQLLAGVVSLSILMRNRRPLFHEIVLPALLMTSAVFVSYLLLQKLYDVHVFAEMGKTMHRVAEEAAELLREQTGMPAGEEMKMNIQTYLNALLQVIPGITFSLSLITVLGSSVFSHWILHRTDPEISPFALNQLRMPRAFSVFLLLVLLIAYFLPVDSGGFRILSANIIVIAISLFVLNGLGAMDRALIRKKAPFVGRIVLEAALLTVLVMPGMIVLLIMGIIDSGRREKAKTGFGGDSNEK